MSKVGCLYGRSDILLKKFYFCSERVKNKLFSSHCSNLFALFHTITVSEFYIICIIMRCSASFMFANALVDSCSMCIRKSIFSLMSRLNTSTKCNCPE